jgi:two-component system, chemotaxis family, sensor kinase CheA
MAEDPYRYFRLEARELLDQFGAGILDLEKSGSPLQVQRLLRLAHTLKGAARIVKQPEIADAAHAIEDALEPFREAVGPVPRDGVDAVLRYLDAITFRVRSLAAPGQPEATAPEQLAPTAAARTGAEDDPVRTVRVEIAEMDALLDGVAETHVLLTGMRATLRSIGQARHFAELVTEQLAPHHEARPPRAAAAAVESTYALAEDLRRSVGAVERQLGSAVDQIDRELRQLRDTAEQLRLAPAGSLFTTLERTARDAARALAKEITFEAGGGDIRLDADILATVQRALVQLVRNCVAHGIETPSARQTVGKPAAGRVALDIARRDNRILFTCRDDGAGVDLDRVRRAALRRGLAAQTVNRLGAQELINLLLRGGISTADAVTEIAGRGVGLDIVREVSEQLGGTVAVATEAGAGTTFQLAVPLSLVSMEVLVIEAGGTAAAVPLDAVRSTMLLDAELISRNPAGATVLYEQQAIPFLWLPRVFNGERLPAGRKWPTLVIAVAAGTVAVAVDRLLGTRRTVVRPLPDLAPAETIVAGALFDAEGNPQLVLSPEGLIEEAQRPDMAEPAPEQAHHPVLVIDDSLTTRMLEQSILESAGYEVDLAASAEDALEIARRKRYALFLVDVEMPGMDGFTFVERVRADPALRDIPAVLVTSRAAPEDRRRGRDAGARGYIVKGEFDQAELLGMIRPLIG